ncbi:hypothetical protein P186_2847 [Pyrobaculum ferrireducens]|uniref:Uncharacterized protein n=1 Tax=Pyrobaculum ferrireducens TaxID=1104324 RepID=G7VFL7_9CREN|nr:hypothetical protein P186_2847 [Pyrobaculum ferrireducens]
MRVQADSAETLVVKKLAQPVVAIARQPFPYLLANLTI